MRKTGKAFARRAHDWWRSLPLSMAEQLRVRQDLALLDTLDPLEASVERHLGHLSMTPLWSQQVPFLLQLPGLGMVCAMTILAAVGDISRFPTSKQLVGYAGLGARIHASGQVQRSGGITKEGRNELRTAMVEAAWIAVEYHAHWKGQYERLSARIGKHKAIVAIARKLLVAVWHVLSRQCADIHGSRAGRCPHTPSLDRTLWHAVSANVARRPRSCATTWITWDAGADLEEIHYSGRVYRLADSLREGGTT